MNPSLIKYCACSFLLLMTSVCFSLKAVAGIQDDFLWAVTDNNLTDVAKLLAKGADPNMLDKQGNTPLMLAAQKKNNQLAQLLLDAGAKLNLRNKYGETAIMLASYNGQTNMVKQFYLKGARINHSGWNPLLYAATNGHTETIQLLLSANAEINATSDNGTTALMMAARGNHLKAVKLLLNNGADPNIQNERGDNALHWAIKQNHQNVVELLKSHGVQAE